MVTAGVEVFSELKEPWLAGFYAQAASFAPILLDVYPTLGHAYSSDLRVVGALAPSTNTLLFHMLRLEFSPPLKICQCFSSVVLSLVV